MAIQQVDQLSARLTEKHPVSRPVPKTWLQIGIGIGTILVILLLWELAATATKTPDFFLPKPSVIARRFSLALADGTLARHITITWAEAMVAFTIAFIFATTLGYLLAKSPLLEKIVSPYVIASQSLPIFAIAPFVLIWLGNGFVANAFMGALVAFFPMLVNTISALRSINSEERDVMNSYAASPRQTFAKLEVPATLPSMFSSIRIGITLAVIGVLVVELFWADRGIGFLLNFAQHQFDTPLLFAGIFALILMNLTMYVILAIIERLVIPWRYARVESRPTI